VCISGYPDRGKAGALTNNILKNEVFVKAKLKKVCFQFSRENQPKFRFFEENSRGNTEGQLI
jgi:hypothetical protein